MSNDIIKKISDCGTVKVANACGVTPAAVSTWKRIGMPTRKEVQKRVRRYERIISQLHAEMFGSEAA